MSRLIKLQLDVTEAENGWHFRWSDDGREGTVPTAAEVLLRAKDVATRLAEEGVYSILMINWHPTTSIGRSVVKALQE